MAQGLFNHFAHSHFRRYESGALDPRVGEQVIEQRLQALHRADRNVDQFPCFFVERVLVLPAQML